MAKKDGFYKKKYLNRDFLRKNVSIADILLYNDTD